MSPGPEVLFQGGESGGVAGHKPSTFSEKPLTWCKTGAACQFPRRPALAGGRAAITALAPLKACRLQALGTWWR